MTWGAVAADRYVPGEIVASIANGSSVTGVFARVVVCGPLSWTPPPGQDVLIEYGAVLNRESSSVTHAGLILQHGSTDADYLDPFYLGDASVFDGAVYSRSGDTAIRLTAAQVAGWGALRLQLASSHVSIRHQASFITVRAL